MALKISNNQGSVISLQAGNAAAVIPSDTGNLTHESTLYIGGTGNVKVTMFKSGEVTFLNCQKGSTLPILVTRVWATGTTATNIIALW